MAKTRGYFINIIICAYLGGAGCQRFIMDRGFADLGAIHTLSNLRNNMDIPFKTNIILDGTWPLAAKIK